MKISNKLICILSWIMILCFVVPGLDAVAATAKKSENKPVESKAGKPAQEEIAPMDKPLIVVDGVNITARDYANFLQSNPNIIKNAIDSETGKTEALREMVGIYMMRKAMYDEGLLDRNKAEPERKEIADAYEELSKRHFPRPPKATDEAAYAYYQAHPGEFGIPGMIRLSQILFVVPWGAGDSVKSVARERAGKALKRLEAGEPFAQVAKELTENPLGRLTSGDIGFSDPDQQDWLKAAVAGLKPGQRTGLVESHDGYEILEVTDYRPGLVSPFANVRDQAVKAVGDEAQKKVRDAYVRELASKAKIEVVMPNIQTLFPNGVFPDVKKP